MSEFNVFDMWPIGIMFWSRPDLEPASCSLRNSSAPENVPPPSSCLTSAAKPCRRRSRQFSVKFYTVAVIFLLFDIEVLFMIPFAVAFKSLIAAGQPCSELWRSSRSWSLSDLDLWIHIRLEEGHIRAGLTGTAEAPKSPS